MSEGTWRIKKKPWKVDKFDKLHSVLVKPNERMISMDGCYENEEWQILIFLVWFAGWGLEFLETLGKGTKWGGWLPLPSEWGCSGC